MVEWEDTNQWFAVIRQSTGDMECVLKEAFQTSAVGTQDKTDFHYHSHHQSPAFLGTFKSFESRTSKDANFWKRLMQTTMKFHTTINIIFYYFWATITWFRLIKGSDTWCLN